MGIGSFSGAGGTVAEPMIVWRSDASQVMGDINKVQGRMQGFATTVRGAGIQMQMFGRGIMGMVGGVVGAFMTFEDAFIGVTRTVDATEAEFDLLEKGLRSMALVIPQTAADLADIMKIAGQMGIRGVDNLLIFTETVARMADVTDLTAESAAFAFARISVIMKEPIENVERLGSTIVELGNNFATTEPLITDAAVRASGAANTLGLSTSEMLGFVAQSTVVMPRAQSAGSSLTRIWTEMAEAAFEGGTSLDRFADLMHLTTEETAKLILENPADAFLLFVKGTGEAIDAGENWVQILKDIGLNQIRTRELVLNLAGNYPELARAIAESTGEWDLNVALAEESERRYASLSSQIQIFKNLIGEINIILGQALAPTIKFLIERLRPFLDIFRAFAEANPKLMAVIGQLVAAFGALTFVVGTALIIAAIVPVLSLLSTSTVLVVLAFAGIIALGGALLLFWEDLREEFQVFIGVAVAVTGVMLAVRLTVVLLTRVVPLLTKVWSLLMMVMGLPLIVLIPLLVIVGAIAAFVAFNPELREMAKEFGSLFLALIRGEITFKEFWERVKILFDELPGALKRAGIKLRNDLKRLGIYIRDKILEWLVDLRNWLKEFGIFLRNWLKEFGIDLRNKLKEFGVDLRNRLKQLGLDIRDKIKEWAVIIRDRLKEFGMGIKNSLRETFDWLITPVVAAWKEIWLTIKFWWAKYVTYIKLQLAAWKLVFKIAFFVIREIFQFVWPIIWGILTHAFNVIKGIVTTGWAIISTIFQIVWDIIVPIIRTAVAIIWNIIVFWFETLKNTFTTYFGILLNVIQIYWALFSGLIRVAILIISGIIRFVMAVIRGDWSAAWDAIKDTVVGVWNIIWDTIKTIAGEIWDTIKLFWGFIKAETSTVWTLIKDSVLDALRGIRDTGKVIFNGFITMIENGINIVLGGIARYVQVIENLMDKIPGFLGGNPFGDSLQEGIDAMRQGIVLPRILGAGGLVMSPTLALVGDKGPELVIPLDKLEGFGPSQQFYAPIYQTINAEDADQAFELMKRLKT